MWQLIAEGPEPQQRWKQRLEEGRTYLIGRSGDVEFPVPWESAMSREHARLSIVGGRLTVSQHEQARNPIFVDGVAGNRFSLAPGQRFVVGRTQFVVRELQPVSSSPDAPIQQLSFSHQDLQRVQFEDADRRLEALARLPEVIGRSPWKEETGANIVALILAGIRHAEAAAVVVRGTRGEVTVTAWERRTETAGTFRPSVSLVGEALHERRSILHIWEKSGGLDTGYTVSAEYDWAFCTPVARSDAGSWGIYVAGRLDHPWNEVQPLRQNLQSDVRFAQLVGEVVSSADRMNRMEGQLSVLRQFLSPPILAALEETGMEGELNTELLNPRVCDVTVLFCDLRGFSHRAEGAADNLPELLSRVNAALEVMSREILDHGGVTGDFLGDAVLGFWGWPFASEDAPLKACRAALSIRQEFAGVQAVANHPLSDFQMGIGIAHGRAVAGKIGTSGRMSVTVFGPVVNLASRLEGMTKRLQVPILLDEATARLARSGLSGDEGRVRQLATVRPYGMEMPLTVSELVPPLGSASALTDEHLAVYEEGVEHFRAGRWKEAYDAFHKMPPSDQAQDFLLALITQHGRAAPPNWRGIIELPSK